jgi:hypothetical protein
MNTRESENYLAISRSSSASKSVEISWAEIYRGQGDPKSCTLSRMSDTTETRNPCVIKVILLACFTYIDIFKFIKSILTY